jgi:hypothetical protein
MVRGVPKAFAVHMLKSLPISAGEYIYVWLPPKDRTWGNRCCRCSRLSRTPSGKTRGFFYEYLALVDAIRLGNQREAGLAGERLSERLLKK